MEYNFRQGTWQGKSHLLGFPDDEGVADAAAPEASDRFGKPFISDKLRLNEDMNSWLLNNITYGFCHDPTEENSPM